MCLHIGIHLWWEQVRTEVSLCDRCMNVLHTGYQRPTSMKWFDKHVALEMSCTSSLGKKPQSSKGKGCYGSSFIKPNPLVWNRVFCVLLSLCLSLTYSVYSILCGFLLLSGWAGCDMFSFCITFFTLLTEGQSQWCRGIKCMGFTW